MARTFRWHFEPFWLDLDNACLWREDVMMALKPKAFTVLQYLVEHAGQLVTKDAVLHACWPEVAVGDSVLKVCINELRKTLGDTARMSRFIATVHRQGYCFVAPVTRVATQDSAAVAAPAPDPTPPSSVLPLHQLVTHTTGPLVGRDAVLRRLQGAWVQALQGQRQVVWVSGEAGIGKTAVVEAFASHVAGDPAVWFAHGQCVEQYGTGEAYLPLLEALGQLCRLPQGERFVTLLRQQAPTWLVQMPWLLQAEDRELLRQELQGATRERMLRELAEVVDTLTAGTPLLLVLEDLHWSDAATLDGLAMLARRQTPARLLLLGTYRPADTVSSDHPLHALTLEVQRYGQSMHISLPLLDVAAVEEYLLTRFPTLRLPSTLAAWLHQRTEGNPLFLVAMLEALGRQGRLTTPVADWSLADVHDVETLAVPEGLRQMLEQQLERLDSAAQRVVSTASVSGVVFAATAVAACLEDDATQVETYCEVLTRQHLLRSAGIVILPDGTAAVRYAFVHALYQQVAYERLGARRRAHLHQRLGVYLEATYGAGATEVAAVLAVHFERGHDGHRAVQYWQQAAANAARRYAHQEVIGTLTHALALLAQSPDTPERAWRELDVLITLGPAYIAMQGYAAPEVEATYSRARALCQRLGDPPQLFAVLFGLWIFSLARGTAFPAVCALAAQLLGIAQRQDDPGRLLEAHLALGMSLFHSGEFAAALAHLDTGQALYNPRQHHAQASLYGQDPGVMCHAYGAITRWFLGYAEQALGQAEQALALALELDAPFSHTFALCFVSLVHLHRRDPQATREQVDILLPLATTHEFPHWIAHATVIHGWTLTMEGQAEAGISAMQQGFATLQATGQEVGLTSWLATLAEAYGRVGQPAAGLRIVEEALTLADKGGELFYLAELYRLKGELLLVQTGTEHKTTGKSVQDAEACLHQALTIARNQQARSWELRAVLSLSHLWQRQGKRADAHQLLAEVCSWFTEGFDTADLQAARALLQALMPA